MNKYYRPKINKPEKCVICGKEFVPKKKGASCCSILCRNKLYVTRSRDTGSAGWQRVRAIVKKHNGIGI